MSISNLIDKQSHKLKSCSSGDNIQLSNGYSINKDAFNNVSKIYGLNQSGAFESMDPAQLRNLLINNVDNNVLNTLIRDNFAELGTNYNNYLKQQGLQASTNAQNAYANSQIAGSVFQGIGAVSQLGMGIWGAVEQYKNMKKSRELADKQIALAQEQIDASKEYRQQRADEIARLKRVRSNTNQRFNSSAIVSRSY